jgi:hypothetical protein
MVDQKTITKEEKPQLYMITEKQKTAVNILMCVVKEAVDRDAFSSEEIEKIQKMINQLIKFDM